MISVPRPAQRLFPVGGRLRAVTLKGNIDLLLGDALLLLHQRDHGLLVRLGERRLDQTAGPEPAVLHDVHLGGVEGDLGRKVDDGKATNGVFCWAMSAPRNVFRMGFVTIRRLLLRQLSLTGAGAQHAHRDVREMLDQLSAGPPSRIKVIAWGLRRLKLVQLAQTIGAV